MGDGSLERQRVRPAADSAGVRRWELDSAHVLPTRFWPLTPLLQLASEVGLMRSKISRKSRRSREQRLSREGLRPSSQLNAGRASLVTGEATHVPGS